MKPALDPSADYVALVRSGFDSCSEDYAKARSQVPGNELNELVARLPEQARVLDLGCGCGVPIAAALAKRCQVTGVDLSARQIDSARAKVPEATFLCADMMTLNFAEARFDAVVSFYAIFHLPRHHHETLLRRIHHWLVPGGLLLASFGNSDEAGYTEEDFLGVTMYWSHFGRRHYEALIRRIGFGLLDSAVLGTGFDGAAGQFDERHPLILAAKPPLECAQDEQASRQREL